MRQKTLAFLISISFILPNLVLAQTVLSLYSGVGIDEKVYIPTGLQRDIGVQSNTFLNENWTIGGDVSYHLTGHNESVFKYLNYQATLKYFYTPFYLGVGIGMRNSLESPSNATGLFSYEAGFLVKQPNPTQRLGYFLGMAYYIPSSPSVQNYGVIRLGFLYQLE